MGGYTSLPADETLHGRIRDRLLLRTVELDGGCWWDLGGKRNRDGYGTISIGSRSYATHRVSYELHRGPIPEGLQIDHLCRNRSCVNPDHLEAVTQRENIRRGNAGKHMIEMSAKRTRCGRGHDLANGNVRLRCDGYRVCLTCEASWKAAKNARQRSARAANPRPRTGEANCNAKLTAAAVREIRAAPAGLSGFFARKYGVSDVAVLKARSGKSWRSVQ